MTIRFALDKDGLPFEVNDDGSFRAYLVHPTEPIAHILPTLDRKPTVDGNMPSSPRRDTQSTVTMTVALFHWVIERAAERAVVRHNHEIRKLIGT